MPVINPYGGYLGDTDMSGVGANPYGGYIQALQQQRRAQEQKTTADALTQMRQLIANMPVFKPPVAQQGYLPPPISTNDVYAPDTYEAGVSGIETGGQNSPYTAVNDKSGAGGKYQFIEPTWQSLTKQGLPLTPEGRTSDTPEGRQQQETAFKELTRQNAQALKGELGRAPTHAELYIAHLLGSGYGSSVLRNRQTPIEALVPESFIKANPFLKGIDGMTLLQLIGRKFNP